MADEHSQFPVLSWKSDSMSEEIRWVAESIQEEFANRLVEHERPFRAGARVDTTGPKALRWRIRSWWNNTVQEDGLGDSPTPYPDRLNALHRSFALQETGTLTLPTRGRRRCKAASYTRTEAAEHADGADVDYVFIEDSEDIIDLDALEDPQVNATLARVAQQTVFSMESIGSMNDGLVDLVTAASQMESLILAPGRYVDDIKAQGNRNRRAIKRVIAAEQKMSRRHDLPFKEPVGSGAERLARKFADLQARAIGEKKSDQPPTRLYKVQADCTIFDVAADVRQDAQKLMELNQDRVDDPMDLRAGDRVEVFRA